MIRRLLRALAALALLAGVSLGIWATYDRQSRQSTPAETEHASPVTAQVQAVRLTPQAQKNLELKSAPVRSTVYWRKIELPGVVVDRPGISDRGVVSPVTGIVAEIHAHPGDTVAPRQALFAIRLASESLHASQLELFKATRDVEIAQREKKRLSEAAQAGALSQSRIIDIDNQISRHNATIEAYRQDLLSRGLPKERINAAAKGEFVTQITVHAPGEEVLRQPDVVLTSASDEEPRKLPFNFELQELNVGLGEHVQAGEVLCHLADHRSLSIEGRAFKDDLPLIHQAAKKGWTVELQFDQPTGGDWGDAPKQLPIHYVANTIDPESRTFGFYLLLENQWQTYGSEDQTRLLWRFRPGDRLTLRPAVDKLENVLVLPREAVVREGPEAFVFRQNGDLFDRIGVQVLHEDRLHFVLANDGSVRPGLYVAQNAAASLNRVLKAQQSSGLPANLHVHADGTVHAPH
jgi:multidrug efflux pump subunit AcrA (membrane-fusion protein)